MFDYKLGVFVALATFFFVYIHSEGIGSYCFDAEECYGSSNEPDKFVCEDGFCKCDENHIPDRDNINCVVDIQKPCDSLDKCFDPNARCVGYMSNHKGTCECNKGFTLDKRRKVCALVIGSNCTTTDQCIEGSCTTGEFNYTQCICNDPLQSNVIGTKCLPALHDDCSRFNECATKNSFCANGRECECRPNFKDAERNNETYCLAMLDFSCKNETYCADIGAVCLNATEIETDTITKTQEKFCACGEAYVRNPDESECLEVTTSYNGTCDHDIQCSALFGFGSECVEGFCLCKESFYLDVDFNRCVRSCLCNDESEINKIKIVLKEIAPTLELVAKSNDLNISRALRRIKSL